MGQELSDLNDPDQLQGETSGSRDQHISGSRDHQQNSGSRDQETHGSRDHQNSGSRDHQQSCTAESNLRVRKCTPDEETFRSCESPADSFPSTSSSPEIFTARTPRKKWSTCTNTELFLGGYEKETSIDGIFIKFENNVPTRIVDKKRCSHISALARVTCVHHHGPPKFVKRRADALKSRSLEKVDDEKAAAAVRSTRPRSAGSHQKRAVRARNIPENQDPLSVYLSDRRNLPSRESLSESTESYHEDEESEEEDEEEELASSDKENTAPLSVSSMRHVPPATAPAVSVAGVSVAGVSGRHRSHSVEEHFLEEGRLHLKESEAESGTDLRLNSVPEDLYKAVQKTPNEHIFAQYGKEIRRVVVPALPMPLDRLLERVVQVYNDTLTRDMVPLKAIYIQDPQTKIFYQLDDPSDVTKGSHIKIHEEFLLSNIDRGSSQSLEDLHNSSNSSISSGGGGFVIPAAPAPKPIIKRPGRSRLSLVEEGLSLIRNEVNNIKSSETGSTVSSQTDFAVQTTAAAVPADVPQLHDMIRKLHGNLLEAKSELAALRRRELETRGDMETIIRSTSSEIARHIEASLPRGIRRKRMEADEVEQRYRNTSERTYSNIKDLEKTVEVMKTDVVKRKVKLDPVQLERMESELLSYTEQVTFMNDTFTTLKESLKSVMKEELEIIVNEEQFLEDEEPMLEEVTIKCEELTKIMETLRKVAAMQRQQGTTQLNIYTASEYDILEERSNVIQAIATLVPNHEERIQSIQATEEFRAAQKRFVKSESDFIAEEIQQKSQTLRKTNAFEELERKRDEALRQMYTAQPPPHKFGRKSSQPQFSSQTRKASIGKSKSMSSIAHFDAQDAQDYRHYADGASDDDVTPSHAAAAPPTTSHQITRSRSFSEKEKQQSSEDEKSKKKTMFAGFFSKKSKSKQEADLQKSNGIDDAPDEAANGDVYVVDTAKMQRQQRSESPSPQTIPRSNTDASNLKKNSKNNKTKANRTTSFSVESDKNKNKKGKNR